MDGTAEGDGLMSKHVYGFSASRDREECKTLAVQMAKESDFLQDGDTYEVEIVETEDHKANNEFTIVIRSDREGHVMPIVTTVAN